MNEEQKAQLEEKISARFDTLFFRIRGGDVTIDGTMSPEAFEEFIKMSYSHIEESER